MGDSLELIGKRLLLLLEDGRSANGSESEKPAWARDWLRGTVRAVSVIGLSAPEVSGGGEATTTTTAAGLTVSIYLQGNPYPGPKYLSVWKHATCDRCLVRFQPYPTSFYELLFVGM